MARFQWIGMSILAAALTTGCVSQEKYNAMKLDRDQQAAAADQAQADARAAQAQAATYKEQLEKLAAGGNVGAAQLANLMQENGNLKADVARLQAQYEAAIANGGNRGGTLDPTLSAALAEFARQNPDLVEFDAARGIVKFKSDVTFPKGSAELSAQAQQAIARFAQILAGSAGKFELMVAGHTDSTPVTRQETIAAGHKDNWYLSAHRAIVVGHELQRNGIAANRMGIAGYADTKPTALNNAAANRRVEVMILPTKTGGAIVSAPKTGGPGLNKDSVAPKAPLNKDTAVAPPVRPTTPMIQK